MESCKVSMAKYIEDVTQNHPPYKWRIDLVAEDGNRMIIEKKDGPWTEAMYRTDELRKQLGLELMPFDKRLKLDNIENHG